MATPLQECNESQRIAYLDEARVAAIVLVCICHSAETIFAADSGGYSRSIAFSLLHTIGRVGVPFFLFITGSLLLNKQFTCADDIFKFYRRNLIPLVVTSELWIVIYCVYMHITKNYYTGPVDLQHFLRWILFLERFPLSHWWYIPMIIGSYVALPFVGIAVSSIDRKGLIPLVCASVTLFFVIPTMKSVLPASHLPLSNFSSQISIQTNTSWWGGTYGVYILFGYLLSKGMLKRAATLPIVCGALLGSALCIYTGTLGIDLWYDNLGLLLLSICAFELLRRKHSRKIPLIEHLSVLSFGVYLLHKPLIPYTQNMLGFIPSHSAQTMVLALTLLLVCFTIAALISYNTRLGKILLLAKSPSCKSP